MLGEHLHLVNQGYRRFDLPPLSPCGGATYRGKALV